MASSGQSSSSSGTLPVSVVHGPESQEVARSAPKKRKIPVGIVLPSQVSFMELETFVDSINKTRGCKNSKCDGNLVSIFNPWRVCAARVTVLGSVCLSVC